MRWLIVIGAVIFLASFGTCAVTVDDLWSGHDPGATIGGIATWGLLLGALLFLVGIVSSLIQWIRSRRQ